MKTTEKNILLALVICMAIGLVGVSFAYFTSSIVEGGTGSTTNWTTADLIDVTYDAGSSALNFANAIPGETASKAFTVRITPTASENSAVYAIILDISSNTFERVNANELTYTLKDNTGVTLASGDLTAQTGRLTLLRESKTVSTATTYNYILEITFVDTNTDQTHNANKTFSGNLEVEFTD